MERVCGSVGSALALVVVAAVVGLGLGLGLGVEDEERREGGRGVWMRLLRDMGDDRSDFKFGDWIWFGFGWGRRAWGGGGSVGEKC